MRRLSLALALVLACAPAPPPTPEPTPVALTIYAASPSVMERAALLAATGRLQVAERFGQGGTAAVAALMEHAGSDAHLALVDAGLLARELIADARPRLAEATLVARLGGEALAVVVPFDSPISDGAAFRRRLEREATSVRFAGREAGSVAHQLAALLVREATEGYAELVYAAYPDEGAALEATLAGAAEVALVPYRFAAPLVEAQRARVLAVSSAQRLAGATAEPLAAFGFDVALADWVIVAAPPGLTAEQVGRLRALVEEARRDPAWSAAARASYWIDDIATEGLLSFVGAEGGRVQRTLLGLGLIRER